MERATGPDSANTTAPLRWIAIIFAATAAAFTVALTAKDSSLGSIAMMTWIAVPILAFPLAMQRGYLRIVHPWTVFLGLFVHGWVLRATLAAYDVEPGGARDVLLYQSLPSIMYSGLKLGALGISSLVVGYLIATSVSSSTVAPRTKPSRWDWLDRPHGWNPTTFKVVTVVLIVASSVGTYLFYRATGGHFGKAFNDVDGGSANRTTTLSYLFLRLSYFGHTAFILLLIRTIQGRAGWFVRVLLPYALALTIAGPVMANSRAGVAIVAVDSAMIYIVLTGKIPGVRIIAGTSVSLVAMSWMLAVRRGTSGGTLAAIGSIAAGRDLFDIGKTAHIGALAGGDLHGQTLYGWLFFPFPAETLPFDKPLWSGLGQYVWTTAYEGLPGNGIPAGLIGELYLNGGISFVIIGMALFGAIVALWYARLLPGLRRGRVITAVLFSILLIRFVVFGLSNDLGTGVLSSLSDALPIIVAMAMIRQDPDSARARDKATARRRRGPRQRTGPRPIAPALESTPLSSDGRATTSALRGSLEGPPPATTTRDSAD